jgi:hypothetical protein
LGGDWAALGALTAATTTAAVAALGQWANHLKFLQLQLLAAATQVKGNKMAQVLQGDYPLELQLEGLGPAAVGPG